MDVLCSGIAVKSDWESPMYGNWYLTEIVVAVLHWTCEIIRSGEPLQLFAKVKYM